MPHFSHRARVRFWAGLPAALLFLGATLVAAAPAAAAGGGHRARLSADLADHLAVGSQSIRVIIHGERSEIDALAARYNLRVARYLKSGAVFVVNAGQLEALRQDETQDHLSGDIRLQSSVDAMMAESIGADQVWAGSDDLPALTGEGISVAVIDSGIDTRHAALRKRVLVTRDFTGGDGMDRFGHGTHVAAIIAGRAGRTVETRDQRGIAPGAYLLNLRVLGDDGSGSASDVIEAIDWTIEHRREYNVRIINLSLGAPVMQPYRDDPLCEAVERAVRAGLVVVVAAGNYGRTAEGQDVMGGIATPGNSPFAITVGALDTHGTAKRSDDTLAPYSAKGPTRFDLNLKPDVVAPGTRVVSAEAADSYLARTYATRHVVGTGANAYIQLSGTSMAAGVVSGGVALLLEQSPHLRPFDTRAILEISSTFMPQVGVVGAGAGSVNLIAAVGFAAKPSSAVHSIIANEVAVSSGILITNRDEQLLRGRTAHLSRGGAARIFPGLSGASIVWGASTGGDSIVWGADAGDSIVWGASGDCIVWGTGGGDSIVWGASDGDSIVWGTGGGDSIVWGASDGDSIVWGASAEGDSIVWGTADTF